MKKCLIILPVLVLALSASAWSMSFDYAQDKQEEDPFKKYDKQDDDDELAPGDALETLKEIQAIMEKAEELLHDSSRGKALETEEELMKKLKDALKDEDPKILQKKIAEKIKKLMEKAQKEQERALDKLRELIKKAKAANSKNAAKQKRQNKNQKQQQSRKSPKKPSGEHESPYNPNRRAPASKFRSKADKSGSWGHLPPALRDAMLHGKNDIDDYPPEFREALKEYMERLADPDNYDK